MARSGDFLDSIPSAELAIDDRDCLKQGGSKLRVPSIRLVACLSPVESLFTVRLLINSEVILNTVCKQMAKSNKKGVRSAWDGALAQRSDPNLGMPIFDCRALLQVRNNQGLP